MKAICWHGHGDVRYESAPDPKIEDPRDAIIRVTRTAICGSDLHLLDGYMPTMKSGDVLGHEFMGEVIETGSGVTRLKKGDRVIVPFNIACGECVFCKKTLFSLCDRSNRNAEAAAKMMGYSPSGLFGYSHMLGGFSGGQAEYVRVPYADVGPLKIPDGLTEDQVLFLTDIFPTGYMAAENCQMEKGDTVAVWGCGPVGQFAIQSAWMFGAGRVIAIDHVPERLALAKSWGKAETIDFTRQDVYETLKEMTGGLGPDRCIDAVGAEAHGTGSLDAVIDKAKAAVKLATDRPHALRQAIYCCRKGGTVSVPGVYVGFLDKVPMGAFVNKGLTMKTGQTHTHRYTRPLLEKIQAGAIDPTRLITHRAKLSDAPALYKKFRDKEDGCIKVVMTP
ncbi:glutathione-dependent formaldehyde dehydrogenase [Corallococcus sp. AB049A]|uniref:zinc-dependent alcohol dehydrogenase n=1 Tax=Corallococcus sp. AB049A TaxID=2316721 RepID=UPI000EA384F7|nr:zinc-dependent alcohol dehydrogenase [Corallococcus sp. AB049A]RKH46011.1 glutathione-dependent formaldehyde dehydrogenase [Corallococcus sp. AB050B]RKI63541.1 glutathione-dependent formaldehyde dehydrogenase [Corallococcus sp. AB049A]